MSNRPRSYIGLACTVHDPAIAVVSSRGEVVFAEALERSLQHKRAAFLPPDDPARIGSLLERYCEPGAELVVAQSWLGRRWKNVLAGAAYAAFRRRISPMLMPILVGQTNTFELTSLNLAFRLWERDPAAPPPLRRAYDHHSTHAAAACFSSPFPEAACAVIDGHGERGAHSFFRYQGGALRAVFQHRRQGFSRHASLGVFYAGLCFACGFDPMAGEEWKVMGLAAYGRRDGRLYDELRGMMRVRGLELRGDSGAILDRFTAMRHALKGPPEDRADLACTGQEVFSDVAAELLSALHRACPSDRLVLSGGCALNSAFNGQITQRTPFKQLYVPSAPADDGNAVGAALLAWCEDHGPRPPPAGLQLPYLGERMEPEKLARLATLGGLRGALGPGEDVCARAAELLAQGKIVGWIQGRAEYGPRALGNRSILADPRRKEIKDELNARVKFREKFRPFAPAILHEHGDEYFEHYQESPYMERALRFRPEVAERVPGVVHLDGTGRLQTVKREWNPRYHELIRRFHQLTGVPVLLNTSFNVMGKPISHSVEDVVAVFFTSGLDALVIEDQLFLKPWVQPEPGANGEGARWAQGQTPARSGA